MRKLNIISLFAGAGGLEIAACSTGRVRKIVSTDSNATFLETPRINMPKHFPQVRHETIVEDVRELKGKHLLESLGTSPDLLMGGPPCDDFTHFGRRMGMQGDKGPLIFEYLRLVDETRPSCFLFENVPNLAQQFRAAFDAFLGRANDLGYTVDWKLLSAADYGAPTMRKRVIAIGRRAGAKCHSKAFLFPEATHGEVDPQSLFKNSLKPFVSVADVLNDLPDVTDPTAKNFLNHVGRLHRPSTVAHITTVPQGTHVKKSYRYRAPWHGLCRSLTAGLDDSTKSYIHPIHHREMSVREYARLQGFPDSWDFRGTLNNGVKQVANAVPTALGIAVLKAILFHNFNDSGETRDED